MENSHIENIVCPICSCQQEATVKHTEPFYTYIHTCINCSYLIMESEWNHAPIHKTKKQIIENIFKQNLTTKELEWLQQIDWSVSITKCMSDLYDLLIESEGWINVETELPKKTQEFNVAFKDEQGWLVSTATFNSLEQEWHYSGTNVVFDGILKYRPLPEKPSEI